jgi:hypothetical protein
LFVHTCEVPFGMLIQELRPYLGHAKPLMY